MENYLTKKPSSNIISEAYEHRHLYEQKFVSHLFDSIAHQYDFLNHILSFGIDVLWRKKAIRLLQSRSPKWILDVATGTGDLAINAACLAPEKIIGIDVSNNMLEIGKNKVVSLNLEKLITFELGNVENLQFDNDSFDAVITAFGVRNFGNLEQGIKEILRVLKDNGVAMILEFSRPRYFLFKQIFQFYFKYILPLVGGLISGNRSAYIYLHSTVSEFPDSDLFSCILYKAGFKTVQCYPLTLGVASIYMATKE